jgi:hypothetical protein
MSRSVLAARLAAVAGAACALGAETPSARAELIYAVTTQNFLTSFDSAAPGALVSGVQITGLSPGELVMGIDFRPSTGVLYGLGSQNRLYTINLATGVASAVGGPFAPPSSGVEFGFDFNPVVDLVRVVSDVNQNFRLSPATGQVVGTDTALAYAPGDAAFGQDPNIVGAAYGPNLPTSQATTLYAIDATRNALVRIGGVDGTPSPNGGQLFTIGNLGNTTNALVGFDISGPTGIAYAAMMPETASQSILYTVNLATGATSAVGVIGGGLFIRGIAVIPAPAGALVLAGVGLLGGARRRRAG